MITRELMLLTAIMITRELILISSVPFAREVAYLITITTVVKMCRTNRTILFIVWNHPVTIYPPIAVMFLVANLMMSVKK